MGKFAIAVSVVLLGAFVLGLSGLPGTVFVTSVEWLVSHGYIALDGPAGEAQLTILQLASGS